MPIGRTISHASCLVALALLVFAGSRAVAVVQDAGDDITPTTSDQYTALAQEDYRISTRFGDRATVGVHGRVTLPSKILGADGVRRTSDDEKVPAILFLTPYSGTSHRDPGALGRATQFEYFVPKGYAGIVADVPGTGSSEGCWDMLGPREQQAAYDVVEWIAAQDWSDGKVAMYGDSYMGGAAHMTAVARPPHLATVVSLTGFSSVYDVVYGDGVRYGDGDPAQFSGLGPAIAPISFLISAAARACPETSEAIRRFYDADAEFDEFWRVRDWAKDAARLAEPISGTGQEVSVLTIGDWRDQLMKAPQSIRWFAAVPADDPRTSIDEGVPFKMLVMDKQGHGGWGNRRDPASAWGGQLRTLVHAWFDEFLYGEETGVRRQPPVWSVPNDSGSISDKTKLRKQQSWPPPGTASIRFFLRASGDLSTEPASVLEALGKYADTGAITESGVLSRTAVPGADFLWFESDELPRDLRIAGSPMLQLTATSSSTSTHFTPVLFDLGPNPAGSYGFIGPCFYAPLRPPYVDVDGDHSTECTISRGFLNARYRDGLERGKDLQAGVSYGVRIRFEDEDWTIPATHRIGLAIMSTNSWWAVPDQQRAVTSIESPVERPATLILPVVLNIDLQVTSVTVTSKSLQGDTSTVIATITNSGRDDAGGSRAEFLLDGGTRLGLIDTRGIPAGGAVAVSLEWKTAGLHGQHTITVAADRTGLVAESDETNNSTTLPVTVKGNRVTTP